MRYVALIGQANCGKATRLRSIGGALLPDNFDDLLANMTRSSMKLLFPNSTVSECSFVGLSFICSWRVGGVSCRGLGRGRFQSAEDARRCMLFLGFVCVCVQIAAVIASPAASCLRTVFLFHHIFEFCTLSMTQSSFQERALSAKNSPRKLSFGGS